MWAIGRATAHPGAYSHGKPPSSDEGFLALTQPLTDLGGLAQKLCQPLCRPLPYHLATAPEGPVSYSPLRVSSRSEHPRRLALARPAISATLSQKMNADIAPLRLHARRTECTTTFVRPGFGRSMRRSIPASSRVSGSQPAPSVRSFFYGTWPPQPL